jgi:flavin reductase (DIM6/NTAB) family NADH-FMN oxidoreductase RutF
MALAAPVQPVPAVDERSLRKAFGRFATGVALVTTVIDGEPVGLIVNSFASVSLEPPLVSFCPSRSSLSWSRMRRTGRFALNVLGRRHEDLARRAAPAGADRFAGVHWEPGRGGVPVLSDALAALQCDIVAEHPAGDHWIVVGRVERLRTSTGTDPLVFFDSTFTALVTAPPPHQLDRSEMDR